jgi:condensin complex subunit 3
LYKIHVSLGKIANTLEKVDKNIRSDSVPLNDKTALLGDEEDADKTEAIKAEEEDDDDVTVVGGGENRRQTRDSLVEDLLSDEDVEMS